MVQLKNNTTRYMSIFNIFFFVFFFTFAYKEEAKGKINK